MSNYPTSVDDQTSLYNPADSFSTKLLITTLGASCISTDTTIQLAANVASLGGPAAYGIISIEDEEIIYTGSSTVFITGCIRGSFGTAAVGHSSGITAKWRYVAAFDKALQSGLEATQTAVGTTPDFNFPLAPVANVQTGTTYTVQDGDRGKLITISNGSAVAVTLPQAGASGLFIARWFVQVENRGAGTVTISVNSGSPATCFIDGAGTLALTTNQGCYILSDGTTYYTQRGIGGAGASPLTTKGDLFGHSTVDARIPIGTNKQVLIADSAQALGLKWGAPSPLTTKGDIYGFDSDNNRVPVGSNAQVLTADSTQTLGIKWATPTTPKLLVSRFTQVSSSSTSETDLYSDSIAGGTLANNGDTLFVTLTLTATNGSASPDTVSFFFYFGGSTTQMSVASYTIAVQNVFIVLNLTINRVSSTKYRINGLQTAFNGASYDAIAQGLSGDVTLTSGDFTGAQILKCTGQTSGGIASVRAQQETVQYVPGP